MAEQIKFLPAIPIPRVFDIPERIQHLRDCLDPKSSWYQPEQQHVNIKTLVKLYEDRTIDGIKEVWIMSLKKKRGIVLVGLGVRPFGPHLHELRMLLRLIQQLGRDGTVCGIIAMNDTGSDVLSLFHSDLQYLGDIQGYTGWLGDIAIVCANGTINIYPKIIVEIQMVRDNNTPWSDWIEEEAII